MYGSFWFTPYRISIIIPYHIRTPKENQKARQNLKICRALCKCRVKTLIVRNQRPFIANRQELIAGQQAVRIGGSRAHSPAFFLNKKVITGYTGHIARFGVFHKECKIKAGWNYQVNLAGRNLAGMDFSIHCIAKWKLRMEGSTADILAQAHLAQFIIRQPKRTRRCPGKGFVRMTHIPVDGIGIFAASGILPGATSTAKSMGSRHRFLAFILRGQIECKRTGFGQQALNFIGAQKFCNHIGSLIPPAVCNSGIVVKGTHDLAVRFSKCCNPVPGDEIVGFVTRGRGITIHRTDCINVLNLPEMERSRLIDAEWQAPENDQSTATYATEIVIFANNRIGMFVDISKIFTERQIDVKAMNARTNKQGKATITLSFDIHGTDELNGLMAKLRQIDGILDIERTSG